MNTSPKLQERASKILSALMRIKGSTIDNPLLPEDHKAMLMVSVDVALEEFRYIWAEMLCLTEIPEKEAGEVKLFPSSPNISGPLLSASVIAAIWDSEQV